MAQPVQVKRSSVPGKIPLTTDLALGELAVNSYDGRMYIKKDDGAESIVLVNSSGGGSSDASTLSGNTLASNVVNSSLTSVGTLTGLTVNNKITVQGMTVGYGGSEINQDNLAIGFGVLPNIQDPTGAGDYSKSFNVGVGRFALNSLSVGANNLGVGGFSLQNNITGNSNLGFGAHSLQQVTTGDGNIGIGMAAGGGGWEPAYLTTGDNNIFIGSNTVPLTTNDSGSIVIGGESHGSNTVTLGKLQTDTYLAGTVHAESFVGDGSQLTGIPASGGITYPIGTIIQSPQSPSAPGQVWSQCNGAPELQTSYPELFSAIGHRYQNFNFSKFTSVYINNGYGFKNFYWTGGGWVGIFANSSNLYYSYDSVTWVQRTPALPAVVATPFLVSNMDASPVILVFNTTTTTIYRTTGVGGTFLAITTPVVFSSILWTGAYFVAFSIGSRNVYYSADGSTWSTSTNALPSAAVYFSFDGVNLCAVKSTANYSAGLVTTAFYTTTDLSGATGWINKDTMPDNWSRIYAMFSTGHGVTTYLSKSTNNNYLAAITTTYNAGDTWVASSLSGNELYSATSAAIHILYNERGILFGSDLMGEKIWNYQLGDSTCQNVIKDDHPGGVVFQSTYFLNNNTTTKNFNPATKQFILSGGYANRVHYLATPTADSTMFNLPFKPGRFIRVA